MTSSRLKDIQSRAVSPASVQVDGNYTHPRTWGVYKVHPSANGVPGEAYRMGNHPVRRAELEREYGAAKLLHLFTFRADAMQMKSLLNSGG